MVEPDAAHREKDKVGNDFYGKLSMKVNGNNNMNVRSAKVTRGLGAWR